MDIDLKYKNEQELPFDDCRKLFGWLSVYIENKFTSNEQAQNFFYQAKPNNKINNETNTKQRKRKHTSYY